MKKVYSMFTRVLIFSMIIAFPLTFVGQDAGKAEKKEKKSSSFSPFWFGQLDIGAAFSHADLARYGLVPDISKANINGSGAFGRQFTSVFSAYVRGERGFITGDKKNVPTLSVPNAQFGRDMYFDMDYYGGSANVGINLSNLFAGYKERLINIGVHAGFGQVQWKSRLYESGTDIRLRTLGYKGTKDGGTASGISERNIDYIIPVGANVDFRLSDSWDIYADYNLNFMDTDYADGIIHGEMQVYNDMYSTFNVGARFKFGGNKTKKMAENFDKVQLAAIPSPLEEKGDSVTVTINGTFPPKYFDKKSVMCFNPVLQWDGGEAAFETMTFKGEDVAGDGTLVSYANGGSFTYTSTIPYDPAMNVSELVVAPVFYAYDGEVYESCADAAQNGKKAYTAEQRKLSDGVIHTSKFIRHSEAMIYAPDGYEKETIITQKSNLYFQVNLSRLDWKLPLNKNEDNSNALKGNTQDMEKGWALKNITIDGWASPEGEETFNQGLSQRRAETAQKYMSDKIKGALKKKDNQLAIESIDDVEFVLTANGPDWNGFMKAVEASSIQDKNAILNVVNSAGQSKKEEEIRNMILIYPELESNILPPLRRADIKVNTYLPKKTDAQIAEYSTTQPDMLDINELLYAATLTDDLNTKKVVYANAMASSPKCWRAVVNAATVELALGNYDEAKVLLDKAAGMNDNSLEVHHAMGVYYMLTEDYLMAEQSLLKAKALGADASYNLGVVNIFKGDYAKAASLLSGYPCDFNLGLAQLLNKDYSKATETLKCGEQDAETFYLIAIANARQEDKAGTLEYLSKSIKENGDFAKKAAMDREFLFLFDEADFQALTATK